MEKQDWNSIYLNYVNTDQKQLAKEAKDLFFDIFEAFSGKLNDKEKGFAVAISLFASFIDADRVIAPDEWALFNFIFNVDEVNNFGSIEKLVESFRNFTSYEELDKIVDACNPDLKNTIIEFGLCVCAIDQSIAISEQKIIEKYAD